MSAQTKRNPNFTTDEVRRMMDLIKKYKNIIENKKSDQVFLGEKMKTWKKIETEFNSSSLSVHRDAKTLKMKYENIKKNTKKKFAEEKRELYATGGGRPANVKFSEIDDMVNELIQEQVSGLEATYDSDYLNANFEQPNSSSAENQNRLTGLTIEIIEDNTSAPVEMSPVETSPGETTNENCEQPGTSRPRNVTTSQPRKRKLSYRRDMCSDKWQNLAEEKIKLVQLQRIHAQERHDIEIKLLMEEHALKMQILKCDVDDRHKNGELNRSLTNLNK